MYSINAQLFQMTDSPRLCQRQEFPLVLCFRTRYGEVAMMHFINDQVDRCLADGTCITFPPYGIGRFHLNNSRTLTIYANSFCENARTLPLTDVEGIEASHHVAFYCSTPQAISIFHLNGFQSLPTLSLLIDSHFDRLRFLRCKETERSRFRSIGHLVKTEILRCCS